MGLGWVGFKGFESEGKFDWIFIAISTRADSSSLGGVGFKGFESEVKVSIYFL